MFDIDRNVVYHSEKLNIFRIISINAEIIFDSLFIPNIVSQCVHLNDESIMQVQTFIDRIAGSWMDQSPDFTLRSHSFDCSV